MQRMNLFWYAGDEIAGEEAYRLSIDCEIVKLYSLCAGYRS